MKSDKKSEKKPSKVESPPKKKQEVVESTEVRAAGGGGTDDVEAKLRKLSEMINDKLEQISKTSAAVMRSVADQERKVDNKLAKLIEDLSFIKLVVIALLVLVPLSSLLLRR